jgi:hypothetical protein
MRFGECIVFSEHQFNGNFACNDRAARRNGWIDADFNITLPADPLHINKEYRSMFMNVSSSATVYADTANNRNKACYRLTSSRLHPTRPLYESELRTKQLSPLTVAEVKYFKRLRRLLEMKCRTFSDYESNVVENALMPHVKRMIRVQALNELRDLGLVLSPDEYVLKAKAKLKKLEWAKNGKYPRQVIDLTTRGSLVAGYLVNEMKSAMAVEPMVLNNGECEFVASPDHNTLRSTFEKLLNPGKQLYFCYFSDDSCVSIRCVDGIFKCNMDISSCDGSNGPAIMKLLEMVCPRQGAYKSSIQHALKQLKHKLTISSPHDKKKKVKLTPLTYIQYSGSVLTTILNNLSNTKIFTKIAQRLHPGMRMADCEQMIIDSAEDAGFKVTVQVCARKQLLQFLKHSPMDDIYGNLQPVLNLGVLLRTKGVAKGDIPGRRRDGSLAHRLSKFHDSVMLGFEGCGLDDFIHYTEPVSLVRHEVNITEMITNHHKVRIPRHQFTMRYDVPECQFDELVKLFSIMRIGDCVRTEGTDMVFKLDYGYSYKPVVSLT